MGTRADFYVGTGPKARWLGSVGWDGNEWNETPDCPLLLAATEAEYRAAVSTIATQREDWTTPAQGWPWPWTDSSKTCLAYTFQNGKTHVYHFGNLPATGWPDMQARQNVTFGPRSGLIVFGG